MSELELVIQTGDDLVVEEEVFELVFSGAPGPAGQGLPTGGLINQLIRKTSSVLDFATEWFTITKSDVGLGNVTDDAQLKRSAGDFESFTEKISPVDADKLLLEDSSDGKNKKSVQIGNFPFLSSTLAALKIITSTIGGVIENLYPWQAGYRQDLSSSSDPETLTVDWSLGDSWVVQINHDNVIVEFINWTPRPRINAGSLILIGVADVTGFSIDGPIFSPGDVALTFNSGKSSVVEYYSVEGSDLIQEYQITDDIFTIAGPELLDDPTLDTSGDWNLVSAPNTTVSGGQMTIIDGSADIVFETLPFTVAAGDTFEIISDTASNTATGIVFGVGNDTTSALPAGAGITRQFVTAVNSDPFVVAAVGAGGTCVFNSLSVKKIS